MRGLGRLLGSIRMYTALTGFLALAFPVVIVVISVRSREASWPFIQRTFRLMLGLAGVRVRVVGLDQIDTSRAYITMGNHVNWLDHFILASVWPRPFVGFEKTQNFKVPIYGPMMKKWGNVGVSRKADLAEARRAGAEAAARLAEGVGFLVFPEGTRTRTGAIGSFKKGGFHAAIDANAWILPFTFNGARECLAPGRWWAMPGDVEIAFSAPIDATAYGRERLAELMADTRAAIAGAYRGEGREAALAGAPEPDAGAEPVAGAEPSAS